MKPSDRIPYVQLTPAQRDSLHSWVRQHGVDPADVPIDADIRADRDHWLIPTYVRDANGSFVIDGDDLRRTVVRAASRGPLPWPTRRRKPSMMRKPQT